jgi:hypothetical protein
MQKIDLREVWINEAGDFTPWLAKDENIALLGEALGIELEVQKQEAEVGPYRADILCKETETGRAVLIENQLEDTDHGHLGQILTYAAGLNTPIIIWIAQEFTEQHRAVLDWLNEKTDGKLSFFGVEVELWKIGNSSPAPKFNVVSKPNDWSNRLKQAVLEGGLTATEELRVEYWTALVELLKTSGSVLECKEPAPKYWLRIKTPLRGYTCGFEITVRDQFIDVYFGSRSEDRISLLRGIQEKHKEDIGRDVGEELEWSDHKDKGRFYVTAYRECDPTSKADWNNQQTWLKDTAEKMVKAFSKYLSES